jgi:hypothetical protein
MAGIILALGSDGDDIARESVMALRFGGDDAWTLARAAYALGHFGEDIDAAIALVDRSLQINPSFAYGWQRSGWLRLWAGNPDLAISHLEAALRPGGNISNIAAIG